MIKQGTYISSCKQGDLVPCSDACGEVVEVGERVRFFKKVYIFNSEAHGKGDRVCPIFNQEHFYGDMTIEARETGLGGQIDGVLQEYRIVPGTYLRRLAANRRRLVGQSS